MRPARGKRKGGPHWEIAAPHRKTYHGVEITLSAGPSGKKSYARGRLDQRERRRMLHWARIPSGNTREQRDLIALSGERKAFYGRKLYKTS